MESTINTVEVEDPVHVLNGRNWPGGLGNVPWESDGSVESWREELTRRGEKGKAFQREGNSIVEDPDILRNSGVLEGKRTEDARMYCPHPFSYTFMCRFLYQERE